MLKTSCLFFSLQLIIAGIVHAQAFQADSLIQLLPRVAEDTTKVKHYLNITGSLKFTDPAKAIEYGRKGILLSKQLGFDKGTAGCYLNVSTAYIYSDKLDTALLYLDTALQYAHKVSDPNRLGLAYLNRADIYRQLQNFTQSLKDCETALKYADQANNDDVRARINQTLGAVYYRQDNYPQSILYYDRAIALYRTNGNPRMTASVLNNLGLVYKSMLNFSKAVEVSTGAIHILDSLQDITNLSLFNGNLSDIYYQMGSYALAEKYADTAMYYAQKQNNEQLMALAWVFMGNTYIKQKRYAESIAVSTRAMEVFKASDNTDRINTTADMLAEAYALSGNYARAYEYIMISKAANDSVAKWKYDDDLAAMQTKFKVDEKDKEILLLAKDKELQQQKLQKQRLLMIGIIALSLLILGAVWLLMNRSKLQQRMKELELRNRIAADLHDEVGSSLSSIHMLSQIAAQQPGSDAKHNDILSRMSSNAKETMEKMGDIVWMIKPGESEGGSLKQRMERFAYEICGIRNIETALDLDGLEPVKLSMEQRKNIYLIFKEALNNAVKYSGTEKIEVKAAVENKKLTMLIKDHGKGFDSSIIKKGNGLDNMKHRAEELNGKLEIDSATGAGTLLQLIIPV